MKKRILSMLLAFVLMLSAVPVIQFDTDISAAENITEIASFDQLVQFFENAQSSVKAEAVLTADITADSIFVGGYDVTDMHLDGQGFSIIGLQVEGSLFGSFTNSSLRNLTFTGAEVENTSEDSQNLALIAQNISDKNSVITNCIFDECTLYLPDKNASAGFAAVSNSGIITNCRVEANSVIECEADNTNYYKAGGVVAKNANGGQVINCISKVLFDLKSDTTADVGGIAAENYGTVNLCYVDCMYNGANPVVGDISSINNCVYKTADGYVMGKNTYASNDLKILAADMSHNVMNYISKARVNEEDYPVLWSAQGTEPQLSADLKTAQVYLIVDKSMDGAALQFGAEESCQQVDTTSGRKYSVAVGRYDGGKYTRNSLTVTYTFGEDSFQMVNSFVYSPVFTFMEKLTNPYENTNYSTKYLIPERCDNVNTHTFELLPYCWSLSLTNVSENDEIVAYEFDGKGTEASPYEIKSEYELQALSKYVAEGAVNKDGNKYSSAHYQLENDISDVTVAPIGQYGKDTAFSGTFDGGSHIISNLKVTYIKENINNKTDTNNYFGLFGYVSGTEDAPAVIKNLNILNASIATEGDICGIVAGQVHNGVINGCVTSGVISGGTQVAGVAGYAHKSKIVNCGSNAQIITNHPNESSGGIAGYSEYSQISNCYYSGQIINNKVVQQMFIRTGGIVGYCLDTTLSNCSCNVFGASDGKYTGVLFDSSLMGVKHIEDIDMKSETFLENLQGYSLRAGYGTFWGKDESFINNGYPLIVSPDVPDFDVICISTDAGYLTSDVTTAKTGEKVTLTVHSVNAIKSISITNLNREVMDVECILQKDGIYYFTMPACSVRVVPEFDAEVHFSGKGTAEDPYIVSNFAELSLMSDKCYYNKAPRDGCEAYPGAYYELSNDIDCGGNILRPMGNRYYPFSGHFDGNGYTISNLTPKATDAQVSHDYAYPAVFGYCGSAEIHNITFENISLSGSRAAVIASTVWGNTDIYNVTIRNCVFNDAKYAGGFVSQGTNTRIVNCHADNITFNNCENSAYVIWSVLESLYINNILVENSKGVNEMIKSSNVHINTDDYTNYYSCNTDISAETHIDKSLIRSVDESQLTDKEFIAELSENVYYINDSLNFNNFNFWGLGEKIELAHENGVTGIMPIHYAEEFDNKQALEMFESRVNAIEIGERVDIPLSPLADISDLSIKTPKDKSVGFVVNEKDGGFILSFIMPEAPVIISNSGVVPAVEDIPGTGTYEDPYRVSVPQHLMLMAAVTNGLKTQYKDNSEDVDYINACFILLNDIDMKDIEYTSIGQTGLYHLANPADGESWGFSGTFDGKGYVISNLTIVGSEYDDLSYGLFGTVCGTVKNVGIENFRYTGNGKDSRVGTIAGQVLSDGIITDCYAKDVDINSEVYIAIGVGGGIAGADYSGEILNCYSYNVYIEAGRMGGIVGDNFGDDSDRFGQVTNCYTNYENICARGEAVSGDYYVSDENFASGDITYLLNNENTDEGVWKQNLDNGEAKDMLPVLKGGTVYRNTTCIGDFIEYSNTKDEDVHDYNNYFVCKNCIGLYPGKIAGIYGFDLGLSGSIELNYYMVIDEEVAKDPTAKIVFTVPDGSKENPDDTYEVQIPLSEAEFDGIFYYFSCGIPAKEMGSDIFCRLITDTQESDTFRYSVKEYAEYILANPEGYEDAIPLIKSILNYGAYTQIELEHKVDALANDSEHITDEDKLLPEVDFTPYNRIITGEQEGITFYGSMLSHLTTTDIKLYFDFTDPNDVGTLNITVNGENAVPVKNGSYYEIVIKGTPAQAYNLYHVVKIGNMTLYYSVFSYAASVQRNGGKTETLNLCKSMYVYNQEIDKYLES